MKKISLFLLLFISTSADANWYQDIINAINKQSGITNNLLSQGLDIQKDLLSSQREINRLMRQVNASVTGHSSWGTYQTHDYQSYGASANQWSSVMRMAESGYGSGELGVMIGSIAHQFPADQHTFNRGVPDPRSQTYYAVKTQTILATRAASELDYNKIQAQIAYQQMLQQQIEKTNNLKEAIDLSNRIQVEGNLIQLQILRQVALTNQQQAVTEQAAVNTALSNARFLTKE